VFQGAEEVVFLFCRLLWWDLSELVSVMELNSGYLMGTSYEMCQSQLYRWIGVKISRKQRDRRKKYIYDVS
jgi:hypothetical protein